jgi:hypothetical protein
MTEFNLLYLILFFCAASAILLGVLVFKRQKPVKFVYTYDIKKEKGVFKDKSKVVFKANMLINDVPYGEPIVLGTHEFSETDDEKLDKLIQLQLIPLLKETTNLTNSIGRLISAK